MGTISNITSIGQPLRFEEVVNCNNIGILTTLASTARFAEIVIRNLISGNADTQTLGHLRFLSVVSIGFAVRNIYQTCKVSVLKTIDAKIEFALNIVSNLSTIVSSVQPLANGLLLVKAINSVSWTPPFLIIGSVLQAAGMYLKIKTIKDSNRIFKEFNEKVNLSKPLQNYTLKDFDQGCGYLLDEKMKEGNFITKFFYKDEPKLFNKLMQVRSEAARQMESTDAQEIEKGKALLHNSMQALSKRITANKWSNALKVLIDVISLIGAAFALTPLAPVGFGCWCACGVLTLSNKAIDHKINKVFEKSMAMV